MNRSISRPLRAFLVLTASLGPAGLSQAQSALPNLMTYQAFVTDASNVPLANATPANFVTTFRIYDSATGNTIVWAEQQTVTIFQGNFSVLLGNGQAAGSDPRPPLDTVFTGPNRYMGITVGANPEFTPRQRILPNAYAYRAKVAESVGSVISLNGTTTNFSGGFTAGGGSSISGNLTLEDINVDGGTLDVNTATNTVIVGGPLDANGSLDVDGFTELDGFNSTGNGSIRGDLDVFNSGGSGTVRIKFGRTGSFHSANGVEFDDANGVLIENGSSESGGFFVNGDTAAIWNPGDGDLLSIYDEDALSSGLAAAKRFSINGSGGFTANASSTVTGSLNVSNRVTASQTVSSGQASPMTLSGTTGTHTANWRLIIDTVDPGDEDLFFVLNGQNRGWVDGASGGFNSPSDRRLKEQIEPLGGSLDKALALKPRTYHLKTNPNAELQIGFVAQEVEEIIPELVDEEAGIKGLDYKGFGVIAIGAVQELNSELETLKAENELLRARLSKIEQLLGDGAR